MKGDVIKKGDSLPFALSTKLGWVISGNVSLDTSLDQSIVVVNNIGLSTNELIQKFWALDSVPEVKRISKIDQKCEDHFQQTHFRNESGRYVVKLPFKESPSCLGNSKELALQRFKVLENRLAKTPEIYELYRHFMKEYIDLGHMELINDATPRNNSYYIPHHAVMKESSTTTKLRVVFNASAKTSTGISLNDILMIGPRIQRELFPILLNFRLFPIVVTADVMKMFRQILINSEDRDFQRIIWRNSPKDPLREFRLTTVTYGTTPAPFLATRALYQLAKDEENRFPLAAKAALRDFYVDDLLTGAQNVEECKELVNQLVKMMKEGGFLLRKWSSNDLSVLKDIPIEFQNSSESMTIREDNAIKILGINWHPRDDYFNFSVSFPDDDNLICTKRGVLSDLAKIFDPQGWLAPCVVYAKILIQDLWKCNVSWDEPICEEIAYKWKLFRSELPLLEEIKIPRFILLPHLESLDIYAFCDASEKAYCAAIYVKSISKNSDTKISLLTSKTRVAPIKVQSIPRLELCSAVLLANLLQSVLQHIEVPIRNISAWTDSTVVLAWICSESYRWVPFVANRVEKIQTTIPQVKWRHISGKLNPADCSTRGFFPSQLLKCELWFQGPEWLRENDSEITPENNQFYVYNDAVHCEERKTCLVTTCEIDKDEIFKRFSSWSKLLRVISFCFRFIHNCRNPLEKRLKGFLTTEELKITTMYVVKCVQKSYFSEDLSRLETGKELNVHSRIIQLAPFLDNNGVIRVGGRLKNANIPESQRHPMLLPNKAHVTNLIIRYYHNVYLHASQELLLSILRMQFWILSGRNEVRKIIHKCITCVKTKGQICSQFMGDLPAPRVQINRPFTVTGVDYAGPYSYKIRSGRGAKSLKCYIAIFVCFSTKAVHIELVSDLSAPTFIAALKRFIARRGKPTKIMSDCGSNFKRASKDLKELYRSVSPLEKSSELANFTVSEGIIWSFNPPAAPHFGGIWESNVKSMKFHLKRVIGSTLLTYEEFVTLLTQVEACLNSRPLCAMSSDPNDLQVLTPGHFLIGAPLVSVPESDLTHIAVPKLKRWALVQQTVQHFWKRWHSEYLTTLQQRYKWFRSTPNIKIDDLVLIKNEQLSPTQWKIGRVTQIHPGRDGRVRVVTVFTSNGELKRPVAKLCVLPCDQ